MSCWNPFEELRCNPTVYTTCCPPWLDKKMWYGEWENYDTPALEAGPWEVWNNPVLQELRKAVLNYDYSNCTKCAKVFAGHLEKIIEPWMKPILEVPPRRLWLEHDRHCQLKCPSCRPAFVLHTLQQDKRDVKIKEICEEFMPTALWLIVMSSGEPLVSRSTLEIISWARKYPDLEIELYTNGLLLPERWDLLPEEQIGKINISIDAASKETYENVRRPGKWEKLLQSLTLIQEKRKSGLIMEFQANFVVQAANFREIPAFVRLCKDHSVTYCTFAPYHQLHHTDEEFAEINIFNPNHPEHPEFLKVLAAPIIGDDCVWCPDFWQFEPSLKK